jgi:uncharacterized protein (TIGR03435 family)
MRHQPLLAALITVNLMPAATPVFDVASLKPVHSTGDRYSINLGTARPGEVTLTNATLSDCLRYAYGITNDAQIQGPDWIRNKEVRFDIVAKTSPDMPLPQLLLMLQTLLIERFHLVLHREQQVLPFLALVPGKKAPELREGIDSADAPRSFIPGRIISNRLSMQVLATLLSRFMRMTVLDMTGLKGSYDVKLLWTPENLRPGGEVNDTDVPGPSIFTAVQEQLGLKLESRKGPVEVLVIDQADQVPVEN